jgi:hypothetical protein
MNGQKATTLSASGVRDTEERAKVLLDSYVSQVTHDYSESYVSKARPDVCDKCLLRIHVQKFCQKNIYRMACGILLYRFSKSALVWYMRMHIILNILIYT